MQIFNLPKAQNNGRYPAASESAACCTKLILLSVSTYNFCPVQKDSWLQGVLEKEEGSLPTGASSPGFPFCSLRSPKAGWNGIETLPFPREADSNQTSSCVSPSFSKHMVWHSLWNNLDRVIRKLNCSQKKANGKSTFACLNEFTRRLPSIVPQALCTCSCSGSWPCASRVSAQGQRPDQVHRVRHSESSVMMCLPVETHLKAQ